MLTTIKTVLTKYYVSVISLWLIAMAVLRPLSLPDEGRYAGVARWMVQSGDWLTPRINGIPFLHKPPLMYWLDALCMKVIGINLLSARFASLCAAIVLLFALDWFIKRHVSQQFARLVVLFLASNLLFFGCSQYANHDLLVAVGISVTVLAFADVVLTGSKTSLLIGYTACAAAMMSKGLIGVLIPGMVLLPWILAIGAWRKIPALLHPLAIAWFLVLTLPWLWLMQVKYPNFLHYFFIEQQFNRFSGDQFNNVQSWYFYLAVLLVSSLPLFILASWKNVKENLYAKLGKPLTWLCVWWFVSATVFFSLPASKLVGYIMPALAPMIILLAALFPTAQKNSMKYAAAGYWLLFMVLALLSTALVPKLAAKIPDHQVSAVIILSAVGVLCACVVLGLYATKKLGTEGLTILSALLLCTLVPFAFKYLDKLNNHAQLGFASALSANTTYAFSGYYYYDVPYLLNLQKPVAVVDHWEKLEFDTWQEQLHQGIVFEPEAAGLLWSKNDLIHKVAAGEPLVLIAGVHEDYQFLQHIPRSQPELNNTIKITPYRNYVVYALNCVPASCEAPHGREQ